MLTIHDLQVQFNVAGDNDAAVFSRMFAEHITRWNQAREMDQARRHQMECERSLGDQAPDAREVAW